MEEGCCKEITVPICVQKKFECCSYISEQLCEPSTTMRIVWRLVNQTCEELEMEVNERVYNPADVIDLRAVTATNENEAQYLTCTELRMNENDQVIKVSDIVNLRKV